MDQYNQAYQLMREAKSITLLTHFKPDGDGMSACAALDAVLSSQGKQVETIYPSHSEQIIKRQAHSILINEHKQTPDLIIACDTANYDRLYFPNIFTGVPFINIDHHISNSLGGTVNLNNPDAASTCEELYVILKGYNAQCITKYVAECLMTGILYDTQAFHTSNTTARTLRVAAELAELGADIGQLNQELIAHHNPAIIRFWGKLLESVVFDADKDAAWIVITQQDLKAHSLKLNSLVGFTNFLAQLSDIDTTIVAYETEEGFTKLSFRSKKRDVNTLAGQFGGGGHKRASGALIKQALHDAMDQVTQAL